MTKALEEFFKMRDTLILEGYNLPANYDSYIAVEKALKALEILKEYVYVSKPYGMAMYICLNDESIFIPQEKYDLLKEVL